MNEGQVPQDVAELITRGMSVEEFVAMEMNRDKQKWLKQYTDKTIDKTDDLAYASACALFSTILVTEAQFKIDVDPADIFQRAADAGYITRDKAFINSYEGVAKICGVTVKKFETAYLGGNEDKLLDLFRNRIPVVMFLGAPDKLNHVEPSNGFIKAQNETLVSLHDVGGQGDAYFGLTDRRTFHFEGSTRKYSIINSGTLAGTQRRAYKFGYFIA
jgi:hypothetical protein